MSDDISREIDGFLDNKNSEESARPRRRRAAVKAKPESEPELDLDAEDEVVSAVEADEPADEEEEKEKEVALPRELPRPSENQKTLSSVLSKYGIGENPQFYLQLHRTLPKYFPGGMQAHGYIDEYRQPITEEYISSEYGGGTYSVKVYGPNPKGPSGNTIYASVTVEVAGPPNADRLARSVRAKLDQAATPAIGPSVVGPPMASAENPSLAAAAMKMASELSEREREERHRVEDRQASGLEAAKAMYAPIVESEKRRTEDVLKSEREKSAMERSHLEERLRESRAEMQSLQAKVDSLMNNGQSVSSELERILPLIKGDGGAAAAAAAETSARSSEKITESILGRHQIEIESIHKQHQSMLDSMRGAHSSELSSMRDAHAREIEAERSAGRMREQRHEETLKAEREERRRDQELYRKTADDRDERWKERMEDQSQNLRTTWESRVETQKTNYESQLAWMRSETEQLQSRVRELQTAVGSQGDVVSQLGKLRDLRTGVKDALGIDDSPAPAPSGGLGLSGGSTPEWFETLMEHVGPIAQGLLLGPSGPQQQQQQAPQNQQQPQYQEGQQVQTPQGLMIVVRTPNGLAFVKKEEFDAFQAQQQGQQRQGTSRTPSGQRQRGILGPQRQKKPSDGIPVPNMAEGLPPIPVWGEPVQPPMPTDQPPQQRTQPAPQPIPVPAPQRQQPQKGGTVDPKMRQMIANEIARLVHNSVENADEPAEFVQSLLSKGFPDALVQGIAAQSDDQILADIRQVQPNSAGATPMGQRFVREAMAILRSSV